MSEYKFGTLTVDWDPSRFGMGKLIVALAVITIATIMLANQLIAVAGDVFASDVKVVIAFAYLVIGLLVFKD